MPRMILPDGMRVLGADLVAGALDVAQDTGRAVEQLLPGLGQPHAAIGAGEQRDGELVLEALDMAGQRRLGDVKMRRGAGDAAQFGDADEIMQAAQLHRGTLLDEFAAIIQLVMPSGMGRIKEQYLFDGGTRPRVVEVRLFAVIARSRRRRSNLDRTSQPGLRLLRSARNDD